MFCVRTTETGCFVERWRCVKVLSEKQSKWAVENEDVMGRVYDNLSDAENAAEEHNRLEYWYESAEC
jgi:hypothetical protein